MKKWWGIRHVRYWMLKRELTQFWDNVGRHYWLIPSQNDLNYLEDVWRGRR